MSKMASDSEFEIPLGFIQDKYKDLNVSHTNQLNFNTQSFIDGLYAKDVSTNYNFTSYKQSKAPKTSQNSNMSKQRRRKSRAQQTQQSKRQYQLKSLIRSSNIRQKLVLDIMKQTESHKIDRQKNRINSRIARGASIDNQKDNFEYIDIINVELEQQPQRQLKGVTYINRSKLKNTETNNLNVEQHQDAQLVQIHDFNQTYNLVPFGQSHFDKISMLELNKPIYDKNTYRFNVMWWEKDKLTEEEREKPFQGMTDLNQGKMLHPQVVKELKKNLKPLRRHKLISTKYAPLAQFMPNPQGTLQSDGIQNGRMIQTSSEDDMQLYQHYDKKLYEQVNPSGAVDLQESQVKKRRKKKKIHQKNSESLRQFKSGRKDGKKSQYSFENHEIQNKLKRALRKMNDNGWEEDKLFGRGTQQDKPIELE